MVEKIYYDKSFKRFYVPFKRKKRYLKTNLCYIKGKVIKSNDKFIEFENPIYGINDKIGNIGEIKSRKTLRVYHDGEILYSRSNKNVTIYFHILKVNTIQNSEFQIIGKRMAFEIVEGE